MINKVNDEQLNNVYNIAKKLIQFDAKGSASMHGQQRQQFDCCIEYLFSKLNFDKKNLSTKLSFRRAIIDSIKQNQTPNWGNITREIQRESQQSKKDSWKILFGIPIASKGKKFFPFHQLTLSTISIKTISKKTFFRTFQPEVYYSSYQAKDNPSFFRQLDEFLFFQVILDANSDQDAMDTFSYSFDLLRYSINASCSFHRYTEYLGAGIRPSAVVPSAEYFHAQRMDKSQPPEMFISYYPTRLFENKNRIDRDVKKEPIYKKTIALLRKHKLNGIEGIFLRCIEAFGAALESTTRADAFMNFWRVLEIATHSGDKRNFEIINLLKPFFPDEISRVQGDVVLSQRNEYVHSGEFSEHSDSHVNWVKEYAEAAIHLLRWLLHHGYGTTNDLDTFYSLYPNDEDCAALKKRIIIDLQKSRIKHTPNKP
jgi:hypothetical protein